MVGGNLLAVTQRDVKRMLAYSSVANAGYMMVAIATHTQAALQGLLIYLATYAVMNLGAFGVVLALERRDGQGTTLDDFAGLGRRNPALAALMALFMFSLAGIPRRLVSSASGTSSTPRCVARTSNWRSSACWRV